MTDTGVPKKGKTKGVPAKEYQLEGLINSFYELQMETMACGIKSGPKAPENYVHNSGNIVDEISFSTLIELKGENPIRLSVTKTAGGWKGVPVKPASH